MPTNLPYIREADTGHTNRKKYDPSHDKLLTTLTQQITPNVPRLFTHPVTYQYVHMYVYLLMDVCSVVCVQCAHWW